MGRSYGGWFGCPIGLGDPILWFSGGRTLVPTRGRHPKAIDGQLDVRIASKATSRERSLVAAQSDRSSKRRRRLSAHEPTCLDIHSLVGRAGPMKGIEWARLRVANWLPSDANREQNKRLNRELIQNHVGRPIIVRGIPTATVWRAALARAAGAECWMKAHARALFR
jgi:hypothetical protein